MNSNHMRGLMFKPWPSCQESYSYREQGICNLLRRIQAQSLTQLEASEAPVWGLLNSNSSEYN